MKNKRYIEIPRIRIPIWTPNLSGNWRTWLPSRGNVLFTLLVIGALFWAQSVGAFPSSAPNAPTASTGTIAYQGRLADSAGAPLTGTYSMIFRLYPVATGGASLWTEQWTGPNSVQVSDGLFNVMLGSMTSISQTMITGNNNLWLGITVGADDEMLPRVQLGSVPFAMQALTVPDGSITAAKLAPDVSLVPPPNSITTTMIAANAITQIQAVSGATTDSTSSTSWVDVPRRIITMTTSGGAVLAIFSGSHYTNPATGVVGYWRIVRDDSIALAHNNQTFGHQWDSVTVFGVDVPPAGTHTYKVQWRAASGTLIASEGVYTQNFMAVEFKR
ncbi:hypothetical protein ANRL4_04085 [Anaerolineae bacterium]|nr:hypothetical protein ANRL4_04085 [Anaerolineae bacterium]